MAFGFFKKNKKNVEYNPIIPNEDINDPPEDKSKRIEEIYLKQVEEKKKSDPLIGIKLCGNEIYQSFVNALREPDGHLNCNALFQDMYVRQLYGKNLLLTEIYHISKHSL